MTAPEATPRPLVTRRRLVVSVLLALAAVGIVYAFTLHEEPEPVRYTHGAVRTLYPADGDEVPQQTEVFVELQPGYDVKDFVIEGDAVQRDDLDVTTGLNRFRYQPGEGKPIERFASGRTCVTVEFVALADPDGGLEKARWCFFVD